MAKSIYWINKPYEGYGNGLGYSVHNNNMYKHTKKHMDIDDPYAEAFFQIAPADLYRHVEGKLNVLLSMWEHNEIPESYKANLGKADVVFVPCKFCADIFRPYTKREPIVIWEGIEPKDFPFVQRKEPDYANGERFRVFWSGARNTRKGYQYAIALAELVKDMPDIEVYIKTHAELPDKMTLFEEISKAGVAEVDKYLDTYISTQEVRVLGKHKNIFFDMRKIPFQELKDLYAKAHLFLFPTSGEGWGLMGTEALATGCPMLATNVTGVRDWYDQQVGYELDWKYESIKATNYGDMLVSTHSPILNDLVQKVFSIKNNYQEALAKGKTGSRRMHKKFTWEQAGIRLAKALEKL